jgi:hypothetical protein
LAVDGHRFTGRKIRIAGHRWQSGAGDFAAASSLDQIGCCAEQVEALCATAHELARRAGKISLLLLLFGARGKHDGEVGDLVVRGCVEDLFFCDRGEGGQFGL